jgi:hypothetical protein
LATRSQEPALNDGAEISAPGWVAVALLATRQPPAPRSVMSLAPVAAAVPLRAAGDAAIRMAAETVAARDAWAPGACHANDAARQAIDAHRTNGIRGNRFTAGNS